MIRYRVATPSDKAKIEYYHKLWMETGNPVYVWTAIMHCRTYSLTKAEILRGVKRRPLPLPEWCCDYLGMVAAHIINNPTRDGRNLSVQQRTDALPSVLGFVRKGKNAFRDDDALSQALWIEQMFSISTHQLGNSALEAEEELASTLNVAEPSTVRRRLTIARKLKKLKNDCISEANPRKT